MYSALTGACTEIIGDSSGKDNTDEEERMIQTALYILIAIFAATVVAMCIFVIVGMAWTLWDARDDFAEMKRDLEIKKNRRKDRDSE